MPGTWVIIVPALRAIGSSPYIPRSGETLTVESKTLLNGASKFIAAHPLQSLGLALAAGYLLSRLTR